MRQPLPHARKPLPHAGQPATHARQPLPHACSGHVQSNRPTEQPHAPGIEGVEVFVTIGCGHLRMKPDQTCFNSTQGQKSQSTFRGLFLATSVTVAGCDHLSLYAQHAMCAATVGNMSQCPMLSLATECYYPDVWRGRYGGPLSLFVQNGFPSRVSGEIKATTSIPLPE